ncbi:CCA tRNA nucleotidyltransferase [Rubellicoccus peritrichatus]|uniref:HD domain-containing protein n=1 Tax=Rubellicoccus peritrichatus TaxID=3080537 RepID=A0AAQ3QSY1_9BACT|nr:HD domain-containing protein [Puniceicoccus sp. CR14]WOO43088.1 HD domain-containing protein [Puniceicoccus sp. CR14]
MIQLTPQEETLKIAETVRQAGGRALFVGGWVRDALLGIASKDIDIEVYGLSSEALETLLNQHFRADRVGKAFAVYKLKGLPIDVSLPRRESKTGTGHKGFTVEGDPQMSFKEAASRRDFTLNAVMWDPLSNEIIDPYDGQKDLEKRQLRHVSDKFSEDPLRVLRGMQFVARFGLTPAPETITLCQNIEPEGLPKERLFEEWKKLFLRGVDMTAGLNFLKDVGWVKYFPELEALIDCKQDPKWHPEGDVWTHTSHCLDTFARNRINDDWEDLIVGLAVLCHDFGKPMTTIVDEDGRIRSPKHETVGLRPAESFLRRLTDEKAIIEEVLPLVEAHMRPNALYKTDAGDAAIRRLARLVKRIDRLLRVVDADMGGRPPLSADSEAGTWLKKRAEDLAVKDAAPEPIILGRHLIDHGLKPGTHFGEILKTAYEAQLDGAFQDIEGALAWLNTHLSETA